MKVRESGKKKKLVSGLIQCQRAAGAQSCGFGVHFHFILCTRGTSPHFITGLIYGIVVTVGKKHEKREGWAHSLGEHQRTGVEEMWMVLGFPISPLGMMVLNAKLGAGCECSWGQQRLGWISAKCFRNVCHVARSRSIKQQADFKKIQTTLSNF